MDIIRTQQDLGGAIKRFRQTQKLTQVEVSRRANRSRDVLYRLELGKDVSVSALMDILASMGATLEVRGRGLPTMEEMRKRFAQDGNDSA
ncbi:MAG: helix-turn-helix transcriptional regulator [Ramlibacter sp.]